MEYIILGLIIFCVISFLVVRPEFIKEKKKVQDHLYQKSLLTENQQYYIGDKCIGLSPRKGYDKFHLAGAYYQNLPISMVGKFNGYVTAQNDNQYDKYAIAVFDDKGAHLGFLPKGNRKQHSYILAEGGKVHAYGYLLWNGSGMNGEVCVETDKTIVTKRNKPYETTN